MSCPAGSRHSVDFDSMIVSCEREVEFPGVLHDLWIDLLL